ncbi:MAG: hypothetical protein RIQ81_588 [Pseudomonadota bacterium]|jgi:hypothetical protein
MLELVPEKINQAVILNVHKSCPHNATDCSACQDLAVGLHNWLVAHEFRYLVLDLQDEKDVCPGFIEEVLQLWKRMRVPFLFSGVMIKPRKVLESYNYQARYPIYLTPEEAVRSLNGLNIDLGAKIEGIEFGVPIPMSRLRQGTRVDGEGEGEDVVADDDVAEDDSDDGDDE